MSKMKKTIKKLGTLIIVSIMLISSSIYVTAVENDDNSQEELGTEEVTTNENTEVLEVNVIDDEEQDVDGVSYNPEAARSYAYNNYVSMGKTPCDQFVAKCLRNGGIDISESPGGVSALRSKLQGLGFQLSSELNYDSRTAPDGYRHLYTSNNSDIAVGDVLIFSGKANDPSPAHAALVTSITSSGEVKITHVNIKNGSGVVQGYKDFYADCGWPYVCCLHYSSSSGTSDITNTDATYSGLSGTDVTIVSTINNPNGELINKAGFWIAMKDSPKNHIIDYVEDASVTDTYFWQWYTMSEKGVTLQPGVEYVFQLWVEANGVRAESPIGSVKAISSSSITNTDPTYSDLSGTDVTIVSTINNPNGELINKAGFWIAMKDSPKNHIIDYVENANVTDTHFWQWYTMSEKGVILQPGVEYVFQLWVEANGVRAESPIGIVKTNGIYDVENPVITDVKIENLTKAGYDVSCVVTDNVGVTSVKFESWTVNNGDDDVVVCDGVFDKASNRWYGHVNVSEHNGEVGNYKNRITAYDACQNSANTLTEDVFVGDNGKDSSSSSSKDSSSSSSKSGSSSSSKDRILDDKVDTSSMEKVTSASGTTFFVGDSLVVDLVGIDSEKLHVKGRAGSYKVVTDLVSGKRVGVVTAMKKGTVKLYTVNGKKKTTACVLKAEQPKIKKSLKLKMGKSKKLKISGTKIKPDTWVSSDQSIISVNSDGTITAKKAGTAIVTATIGKHSFNCNVIVK